MTIPNVAAPASSPLGRGLGCGAPLPSTTVEALLQALGVEFSVVQQDRPASRCQGSLADVRGGLSTMPQVRTPVVARVGLALLCGHGVDDRCRSAACHARQTCASL